MLFRAVIYHAYAHLVPCSHREAGRADRVELRTEPFFRFQPKVAAARGRFSVYPALPPHDRE